MSQAPNRRNTEIKGHVLNFPSNEQEIEREVKRRLLVRRKRLFKTLRLYAAFAACVWVIIFLMMNHFFPDYSDDVVYVEYRMEEGDSLFNVIQEFNEDHPKFQDVRTLIDYALKANQMESSDVKAGEMYQIPVFTSNDTPAGSFNDKGD